MKGDCTMRSIAIGGLAALAATVALPPPAFAQQRSAAYNRALFCAANARFMLYHENSQGNADFWKEDVGNRWSRWAAVAITLGEADVTDVFEELDAVESGTVAEGLARLQASDPNADAFGDVVAKYEECVVHPPGRPEQTAVFERAINCAAMASFFLGQMQEVDPNLEPAFVTAVNEEVEDWLEAAARTGIAPLEDAHWALDAGVERQRAIFDGLSSARESYLRRIQQAVSGCEANPPR